MNQKLANTPAVALIIIRWYQLPRKRPVETISGLINTETGSASFRATFPNPVGLLRSGSSATVRIPQQIKDGVLDSAKIRLRIAG
jgi:membrane fusion protein (multidrug efflux system)